MGNVRECTALPRGTISPSSCLLVLLGAYGSWTGTTRNEETQDERSGGLIVEFFLSCCDGMQGGTIVRYSNTV